MISEFVEYVKQAWKNKPNVSSPLNADRLNHMEDGIENNSNKIKEIVPAVNELTEKMYTPDVIGIQVDADNTSVTFKLKKPGSDLKRYTAILAQTHQNGGLIGLYVISVDKSNDAIEKIAGFDATVSRSEDNVTVIFTGINSIWASGILIAPKDYI